MAEPVSGADHDRVVRFVAATRFPFPGQTDWPPDNVTLTNETERRRAISTPAGPHYPDILVVSTAGEIREVAEVETGVGPEIARVWAWSSAASDTRTKTGVRHFFVYVPAGLEAEARRLLEEGRISYAGLRAYAVDGPRIHIRPVVTLGDPKDHVESLGAA
jgi:hypothetical protein